MSEVKPLGWWAISGESLLEALKQVEAGESADIVYINLYAHSDTEEVIGRQQLYESALNNDLKSMPDPPPLLELTGTLIEKVQTLTGYSYEELLQLTNQGNTEKLKALLYAGKAFYRRGGPESVRAWLEWPEHDQPIELLKYRGGAERLITRVIESALGGQG